MEEDRYLVFYLYSLKYKQMNGQSYLTRQWHCPSKGAKMFNPLLFVACVYCPWFAHEVRFIWQKVWVLECSKLGIKKNSFRNMRFALNLCRTCRPTSFYVRWFSLTSFDVCWCPFCLLKIVDLRWYSVTSVDVHWHSLVFVNDLGVCWFPLVFVDLCWCSSCSLTSIDVCWCLLTKLNVR